MCAHGRMPYAKRIFEEIVRMIWDALAPFISATQIQSAVSKASIIQTWAEAWINVRGPLVWSSCFARIPCALSDRPPHDYNPTSNSTKPSYFHNCKKTFLSHFFVCFLSAYWHSKKTPLKHIYDYFQIKFKFILWIDFFISIRFKQHNQFWIESWKEA